MNVFDTAVKAFNKGAYSNSTTSLASVMHADIVMNKVDDPTAKPFAGKRNVISYLNSHQSALLPQFNYLPKSRFPFITNPPIEAPPNTDNAGSTALHAQISGIGTYQDISLAGPGQAITTPDYVRYFFLFRREDTSHPWRLVHATATPYKPKSRNRRKDRR